MGTQGTKITKKIYSVSDALTELGGLALSISNGFSYAYLFLILPYA